MKDKEIILTKIKKLAKDNFDSVKSIREHLHAHPELSFKEFKTASYISEKLNQAGIKDPAAATKAAAALQKTIKTPNNPNLSDEEKKLLAPITADLITDPATSTAIKAIAKQRPAPIGQQPTTPPPMGTTSPATGK